MVAPHEIRDRAYVAELAASIAANGWQGAPLVVWEDFLITGTHRYAACQSLDWTDSEIPTIDLTEVFEEAGMDLLSTHADEDSPTVDEPSFLYVLQALPVAIREKYGIDRE